MSYVDRTTQSVVGQSDPVTLEDTRPHVLLLSCDGDFEADIQDDRFRDDGTDDDFADTYYSDGTKVTLSKTGSDGKRRVRVVGGMRYRLNVISIDADSTVTMEAIVVSE